MLIQSTEKLELIFFCLILILHINKLNWAFILKFQFLFQSFLPVGIRPAFLNETCFGRAISFKRILSMLHSVTKNTNSAHSFTHWVNTNFTRHLATNLFTLFLPALFNPPPLPSTPPPPPRSLHSPSSSLPLPPVTCATHISFLLLLLPSSTPLTLPASVKTPYSALSIHIPPPHPMKRPLPHSWWFINSC